MAALVDRMELSQYQRVELDEDGVTWIVQAPVPGIKVAQENTVRCGRRDSGCLIFCCCIKSSWHAGVMVLRRNTCYCLIS